MERNGKEWKGMLYTQSSANYEALSRITLQQGDQPPHRDLPGGHGDALL